MSRLLRLFALLLAGGLTAFAGFEVSTLRAGEVSASLDPEGLGFDALAAAGDDHPSLLSGSKLSSGDDRYHLSALSVFSNVALHVKDHYVDPERIDPKDMLTRALEEVERQIAEVLVEPLPDGRIAVEVMGKRMTVKNEVKNLWEINLELREVFRFFEKHLPPQDDVRLIEYAAVNGALSTLDPHSILLKPEAFAEMKTSTRGEFGGLGIVISVREGKLTVVSPIDDTPAARAGLEAGDVISRIGDVSTVSMPVDEAVRMLRGPKGSKVTIWVDREGWGESRKFEIVRERIKLESVESELLSSNVGYIKIKSFQQNTGKDLESHLERLEKEAKENGRSELSGLVLDLRNNPGGLLEQATRVSDRFVSSGDIVTTVGYGNKLREPKRARWSGTETKLPVAVLVNRGSASASEIVAGALKNLDRATIIGETTFGKGSVQVLYDFADNSALKLTIAQYLTPGDISIQNEGVQPDIMLEPAWLTDEGVRMFYVSDEHREASLEKHLDRAGREQVKKQVPTYRYRYWVREPEGAPDDTVDADHDYPVELARKYLLAAGAAKRSRSLAQGKRFVEAEAADEEAAIAKRLGELGVDWSAPPRRGASDPTLEARISLVDPPAPGTITGGELTKIRAAVSNRGRKPVYRVHGTLASVNSAFEGREFMFGRIEPGETKTSEIETRAPREESSRTDEIRLEMEANGEDIGTQATLAVTTRRVAPPRFAFDWTLDDRERGDGDGVLEVGEGVEMTVLVTNVGEGAAGPVSLRLKSAAGSDLFLERGRANIEKIAPGETGSTQLAFRVPDAPSERESLPLEVTIYDAQSGVWVEEHIYLKAAPKAAAKVSAVSGLRRAKRDTTLLQTADEAGPVLGVLEQGSTLEADARVGSMVRVRLPGDGIGFVRPAALAKTRKAKEASIRYAPAVRPPQIHLSDEPGGRVLSGDRFRLEGSVEARELRDLYVLLNGDKVYFDRVASAPARPEAKGEVEAVDGWRPPDEAAVKLPFSVELELEPGLNEALIFARRDDTLFSQRALFLSREAAPAVAERIEGKK